MHEITSAVLRMLADKKLNLSRSLNSSSVGKIREVIYDLAKYVLNILVWPITQAIKHLLPSAEKMLGRPLIRFVPVLYNFIGHLCVETDCYIKERIMGTEPMPLFIMLYVSPRGKPLANKHLLNYFGQRLLVIVNPILLAILNPFRRLESLQEDVSHFAQIINGTSSAGTIYRQWGNRPPIWKITDSDNNKGHDVLERLGIPADGWFVCVHCREGGYCEQEMHDFRNVDVDSYLMAMTSIVESGGWVVRMGDPSMKPIGNILTGIIDYCHGPFKSDWMDVFLCASCKFFLASDSGLKDLANIFGVPLAVANCIPMSTSLQLKSCDLSIPKLYWSVREDRLLTFSEVMSSPMSNFRFNDQFKDCGIKLLDNSPEDVRDLAVEMMDRLEGSIDYTEEDQELQDRFVSLFKPGHYTYGAGGRVGREFLRKYYNFIEA